MGVTVVTTTTASSADVVRLRASVSVADSPSASVVYQLPVAQVEYVDLAVGAILDTRGFYKLLPDFVILLDVAAKGINKPVAAEVATAADLEAFSLQKSVADVVVSDDLFSYLLTAIRRFEDDVFVGDSPAISFELAPVLDAVSMEELAALGVDKFIADGVAMNDDAEAVDGLVYEWVKSVTNVTFVADASVRAVHKGFSHIVGTQDADSRGVNKGLTDAVPPVDLLSLAIIKSLTSAATAQDAHAAALAKAFSDVTTPADAVARLYTIAKQNDVSFADVLSLVNTKGLADAISLGDATAYTADKLLTELTNAADDNFWHLLASRVESVSVPDSGFLRAQNYCDPTYFAEDYVGVSQSF